MSVEELILLDPNKVRNTPSLMAVYLEEYSNKFNRQPNCAGCTFKSDWRVFVNSFKKSNQMGKEIKSKENVTFKLKKVNNEIKTYWKDGFPYRKYDNKMDESFAIEYLTHGTEEQIEARKKQFSKLPSALKKEPAKEVQKVAEQPLKEIKTRKRKSTKK